ncbi:hypothetical protein EPICR_40206 [Candidatus Desulfarcum epimagneticum]|uniref:Uncharacterized protein n=1 Tax=uncultured Desulfobacteraceae bacterium TaxID=218296 RepID=A0A484HMU1_9BACT|nr:hypothetical protein EPICR_40206 [uncultured Desulfobacteraceae bacterium]
MESHPWAVEWEMPESDDKWFKIITMNFVLSRRIQN